MKRHIAGVHRNAPQESASQIASGNNHATTYLLTKDVIDEGDENQDQVIVDPAFFYIFVDPGSGNCRPGLFWLTSQWLLAIPRAGFSTQLLILLVKLYAYFSQIKIQAQAVLRVILY